MITADELYELAKRTPSPNYVLTLYINVDQSNAVNLNRGFETALGNALRAARAAIEDEERRRKFDRDVEAVYAFLRNYEIGERGLFILSDMSRDQFEVRRLDVPVETRASFGAAPYIRPLVEALDEFERYAVVHCSRDAASIYVVELGRGAAYAATEAEHDVHKFDASGRDQMWSQMHFQRTQDLHLREHMKELAHELNALARALPFKRLLLTGPEETVSKLRTVLPETVGKLRVATMPLSPQANEDAIRDATRAWAEQWEREEEKELVEQVITEASKGHRAVTTLDDTFNAAIQGRVSRLVYAENVEIAENQRNALKERVALLGSGNIPSIAANGCCDDALEWMIQAVLRQGGAVEQLRGDAAVDFQRRAGGVGALLRY